MSWQPQAHTCTHKVRTHGCCWSNGATCWCCQASFPDSLVCSCTCVWKKKMNKAAHSAKRSFLPHVCEPTQVNTGAAQPHNLRADSGETDVSSCRLSVPHGARIRVGGGWTMFTVFPHGQWTRFGLWFWQLQYFFFCVPRSQKVPASPHAWFWPHY